MGDGSGGHFRAETTIPEEAVGMAFAVHIEAGPAGFGQRPLSRLPSTGCGP